METLKKFVSVIRKKMLGAIDKGDVFHANEIEANITVGFVINVVVILLIICLGLNDVGVFNTNPMYMRLSVLLAVLIELPILLLDYKFHGDKKWLRPSLLWGLIAVCEIMSVFLGHNVTLIMVFPVLLSIRYFNPKCTLKTFLWSFFWFTVATAGNAFVGVINLNVYNPPAGTVLTIESTLRNAISSLGIDKMSYLKSIFINDYIPRMLAFIIIGSSSVLMAKKGREMTEQQNQVSQKVTRIGTELELATRIQSDMLPCIFPAFPDHGELDLYAKNVPAKEMGGDFYDYFMIDDNHAAIVIADVSGKGIGAALFMTIAKTVLKNQLSVTKSPARALESANRQLSENNSAGLFITVWAGIYETYSGVLVYSNAGHNPPVIYRKGGKCEYLRGKHGLVLCGMDDVKYVNESVVLNKGDEIFLYTDGVTEATNKDNELYGESRLTEFMDGKVQSDVKTQVDSLFEEINRFSDGAEQFDDITMLGMKIK